MRLSWFALLVVIAACCGACDDGSTGAAPVPAATPGMIKYGYVSAEGGPHLVLPDALRASWGGVTVAGLAGATTDDYARACKINTSFALIPCGQGQALVLGGSPGMTALPTTLPANATSIDVVILEAWEDNDLDALVDRAIATLPTEKMADTGQTWTIDPPGGLTMIFAGDKPDQVVFGEQRL